MVVPFQVPPGGEMQMVDPAIKFVQPELRAGFQPCSWYTPMV